MTVIARDPDLIFFARLNFKPVCLPPLLQIDISKFKGQIKEEWENLKEHDGKALFCLSNMLIVGLTYTLRFLYGFCSGIFGLY